MEHPIEQAAFEQILEYLRQSRGFDFTAYKRSSLIRRVVKRMQGVGVESFEEYPGLSAGPPRRVRLALQHHPDQRHHLLPGSRRLGSAALLAHPLRSRLVGAPAAERPRHRHRPGRPAEHQLRRHELPPAQARERRAGRRHRRGCGQATAVGGRRRRDALRPQRLRRRRRRRVGLRLARARLAAALHREVRPLARPAAQLARRVDRRRRHERHDDRRHQRPARGHARRDRRGRRALPPGRPGQPRGQAGRRLRVLLPARHGPGPRARSSDDRRT